MPLKKHIALFGASFNPPHLGHLAVVKDLLSKNLFDELWLVPVFRHAFNKELLPFATRLELIQLLSEDVNDPRLKISTIEEDLNKTPSYTYDTVVALKKQHPEFELTLIIGSDVKNELHKWHKPEELKKLARFYFIPRRGFDEASPYPQVSSSEVRNHLKSGKSIQHLTTLKIAEYLIKNKSYK